MGNEGINHARFNNLLTLVFYAWFVSKGGQAFDDLGGCVIEKPKVGGGAPDRILYVGGEFIQWQKGEPRRVNLNNSRIPDLVISCVASRLPMVLERERGRRGEGERGRGFDDF